MDAGKRTFYLGRYNCIEQLGTGPLGETYRAKIYGVAGFEKQFAVKRLHPQLSEDESFVARFVQAASAFAGLENGRIARVHEGNAQGAHYYIVVDLVRGLDVRKMLDLLRQRGEALAPDIAMAIAVDVAESLDYAHGRTALLPTGVLHLGLTAASVMTTYDGEVKLVDFGLTAALVRPGWSSDDALTPTLAYLPPEVWRGEGFDGRADLFSLGVLLHEMLGGSRVFLSDQAAELRAMIESGPPAPPPADPRLQEILSRALQPDAAQRFASAAEMRAALEAVLGGRLERARADLGTLVRRLAMPRERRTGAFAAVTLPPEIAGALTPLNGTKAPPASGGARTWAPPLPKPPIGGVLSPVPLHNTLAGIGPDDMTVALDAEPEETPTLTRTTTPVSSDDAETRQFLRDDDETNRLPRTDEADLVAKTRPSAPELSVPSTVSAENSVPLAAAAIAAATPPPIPPEAQRSPEAPRLQEAAPLAARPTEASGEVTVSVEPDSASWTPLPLAAPPPSHPPTFASPFEVLSEPLERPRASVPGTRLPQRQRTANRVIVSGIAALATAGVLAVYFGLTLGRHPDERSVVAAVVQENAANNAATASPGEADKAAGAATATVASPPVATPPASPGKSQPSQEPRGEAAKAESGQQAASGSTPPGHVASAAGAAEVSPASQGSPSAGAGSTTPAQAKGEPAANSGALSPPAPAKAVAAAPALPGAKAPASGGTGGFTIESTPPGANIFVDGEPRGTTPAQVALAAGSHRLVVAGEHQKLVRQEIEARAGTKLELTLEPARLPNEIRGNAGLKVRCHSQGELRILVDGADTGVSCPNDERISVAPGAHKIGLFSPRTGETHEVDHEVVDGSHSTRVYVKF